MDPMISQLMVYKSFTFNAWVCWYLSTFTVALVNFVSMAFAFSRERFLYSNCTFTSVHKLSCVFVRLFFCVRFNSFAGTTQLMRFKWTQKCHTAFKYFCGTKNTHAVHIRSLLLCCGASTSTHLSPTGPLTQFLLSSKLLMCSAVVLIGCVLNVAAAQSLVLDPQRTARWSGRRKPRLTARSFLIKTSVRLFSARHL